MTWQLYQGDALEILKQMEDESIHCCVTSPPYWALRDYGVEDQIGQEETPGEYVDKLVHVFREVKRVLRDDGTLWLNIGDTYCGTGNKGGYRDPKYKEGRTGQVVALNNKIDGLKPKDLVGIPWMVAFALRADGWYLRQDIIWHKPNCIPESVTDRCTKAHEYVFLLTKSARYYYDNEAIKEKAVDSRTAGDGNRNKRSVWTIPTKPFKEAHFAVFPPEIPEICIKAGTSEKGCCSKCGSPWQRVTEKGEPILQAWSSKGAGQYDINEGVMKRTGIEQGSTLKHIVPVKTVGWKPTCSCGIEETVPCTVIDPFAGAGTTLYVAEQLGRNSIGIELNPDYCDIIRRRMAGLEANLFLAK